MTDNEALLRELNFMRQDVQNLSAQVQSLTKTLGSDTLPRLATVEQKASMFESHAATHATSIDRLTSAVAAHKMALTILGGGITLLAGGLLAHIKFGP